MHEDFASHEIAEKMASHIRSKYGVSAYVQDICYPHDHKEYPNKYVYSYIAIGIEGNTRCVATINKPEDWDNLKAFCHIISTIDQQKTEEQLEEHI